jgi:hypothetical protein
MKLALTLTLSPREREQPANGSSRIEGHHVIRQTPDILSKASPHTDCTRTGSRRRALSLSLGERAGVRTCVHHEIHIKRKRRGRNAAPLPELLIA